MEQIEVQPKAKLGWHLALSKVRAVYPNAVYEFKNHCAAIFKHGNDVIHPGDVLWMSSTESDESNAWIAAAALFPVEPTVVQLEAAQGASEEAKPRMCETTADISVELAWRLSKELNAALRERDQYKAERDEARRKEMSVSELLHSAKHILEDAAVGCHDLNRVIVWLNERDEWADRESA